jgi:hypothetical protein
MSSGVGWKFETFRKNPCARCTPAASSRWVIVPTDCHALWVPSR